MAQNNVTKYIIIIKIVFHIPLKMGNFMFYSFFSMGVIIFERVKFYKKLTLFLKLQILSTLFVYIYK